MRKVIFFEKTLLDASHVYSSNNLYSRNNKVLFIFCITNKMDIGARGVASVFNQVNTNTAYEIHQLKVENKELFLSRKFFKYQLEECKRDRETLISEVSLLERLLKERQSTSSVDQTRLVTRYESQFEQLRAECQAERNKTKPLQDQITELMRREGDLVKQLADQEAKYNTTKSLLETAEKQVVSLQGEQSDYKERITLLQEKYAKEQKDSKETSIMLSQQKEKCKRVSALLSEEKNNQQTNSHQAEENFNSQLNELKNILSKKNLEIETNKDKLHTAQSAVKEEIKKTNFLFERVKKVDEISSRYHKLMEKYDKTKHVKIELSNKLDECQKEKKELLKKLDKSSQGKSSDQQVEVLKNKIKELESKLYEISLEKDIGKSSTQKEIQTLINKNKDLEGKLKSMQTLSVKDNELFQTSKKQSDEKLEHLEIENNKLKMKGDELLQQIKISLEKETRTEREHREREDESEDKLKELTKQIEKLKSMLGDKIEKENLASNTKLTQEESIEKV